MIKHLATLAALSLLIPMIAAAEPEVEDKPAKFFLLTLEPLPATIFGLDALYSILGTYFLFVYWRLTCRRLKSQPTPLRRPFNYLFGTSFLFFVYCILESLALPAAFGEKGKDFALPALVVLDFEVHLMDISFVVAFFLVLANLGTYNARVLGFTWTGKSPVDYALVGSLVLMQLGSVILSATKKALAYGASRWPVGLGSCYTVFVGLYLAASLVIWGKAMDLRKLVAQNRGSHAVSHFLQCLLHLFKKLFLLTFDVCP